MDDAVAEIILALDETGRLADTLIVFMSDNGLSWGEHRWGTKRVAYEESIRIPLVVRYDPAANPGVTEPKLAVGIDVAPTIADVTRAAAPAMDGVSLLPLVESAPTTWRKDFLVEHMAKREDRVPTYCGVRTTRYTYVYYETGEEELYDLLRDPYELDNLAGEPRMNLILEKLRARLAQLCDPAPPGLLPSTR